MDMDNSGVYCLFFFFFGYTLIIKVIFSLIILVASHRHLFIGS